MTAKTCFKCGASKDLGDFYRHAQMADGHLNKCKECTKKDALANAHKDPEAARERDRLKYLKRREAIKQHAQTPEAKARKSATQARAKARHPERFAAVFALNLELKTGRMKAWPVCSLPECDKKPEAHHPDYSRPLDVVWLCKQHHTQAHLIARQRKGMQP